MGSSLPNQRGQSKDAGKPIRSFEDMFEHACQFLANPWKIWNNGDLAQRRTVLKLAFSERQYYCRKEGLRTQKTTLPFNMLGGIPESEGVMAEAQGFEPWEDFHPRRFSRPVHSTTLPSLRCRPL